MKRLIVGLVAAVFFLCSFVDSYVYAINASDIDERTAIRHAQPAFERPIRADFEFRGFVGERIKANLENWLLAAPEANPAMIEMYRDRDRTPRRGGQGQGYLCANAGEFSGKYLISAVQGLRITKDRRLRATLENFVTDLIGCQDEDGYLGPWWREVRLMGAGPHVPWDLWGHYHNMLGLYLWYQGTGDRAALASCRRAADLFCRTFLDGDKRVVQARAEEMNESLIHIFTLLYEETGEPRYLQMAREILKDWETPPSGDYYRYALAGKEFYECPKPRWESLHGLQSMPELYFITGDEQYKQAFEHLWWSIVKLDRHNTGGFSSGEQAIGNPYNQSGLNAYIETCCTIAWTAMTIDMLRMTGDSRAADEIELSTYNGVLGAQHPSGRWWTYNTPMDGERIASAVQIVGQSRPGSPEINCCAVNGPRGIGILSEWAVMTTKDGIALNYYGPSEFTVRVPLGKKIRLVQETDYPVGSHVRLTIMPESEEEFALHLRIPGWSRQTEVNINGKQVNGVQPGKYLVLNRKWKAGDEVNLTFDMSPRLWVGERECEGKVSIYHGPLLLAYDPRYDVYDPTGSLPIVDVTYKPVAPVIETHSPKPVILLRFATEDGKGIMLCDFASAGAAGNRYVSWLPARNLKPSLFSRENPMRVVWPTTVDSAPVFIESGGLDVKKDVTVLGSELTGIEDFEKDISGWITNADEKHVEYNTVEKSDKYVQSGTYSLHWKCKSNLWNTISRDVSDIDFKSARQLIIWVYMTELLDKHSTLNLELYRKTGMKYGCYGKMPLSITGEWVKHVINMDDFQNTETRIDPEGKLTSGVIGTLLINYTGGTLECYIDNISIAK